MPHKIGKKRSLSTFTLVMINVIAIDSLRNLPTTAKMGLSVAFFYILIAFLFMLPCILITAELATHFPKTGGVYVWVKEAFGPRCGFLTIWLQWVYNLFWYPTILLFITSNITYLINPALANSKLFILPIIVSLFTIASIANIFGMRVSGQVSTISAIFGTLVPILLIIGLGITFLFKKATLAVPLTLSHFTPALSHPHNSAFLVIVLFSLMGLEMSAVHAEDVKNPLKNYPRALAYSSMIILVTLIFASCAIAITVPFKTLSIISGLDQAYTVFLSTLQLPWLLPIIIALIILGSFGSMATWVIGPSKGLMIASQDNQVSSFLRIQTKNNVPLGILIIQWFVVMILCILLLAFKEISSWYWILSDLTGQLALLFYIIFFASAIRLRYKTKLQSNAFYIPGGKISMWITGLVGIFTCSVGIILGFIPPDTISTKNISQYESFLIGGLLLFSLLPIWISKKEIHPNKKSLQPPARPE